MKFKTILTAVAVLCLCAANAGAVSLDMSLNDDSLQAEVFIPVTEDAYGTTLLGVRGLYNDDDETKLVSGEVDFLGKPGDIPGLTAGVGMMVWGRSGFRGRVRSLFGRDRRQSRLCPAATDGRRHRRQVLLRPEYPDGRRC